MIKALSTTAAIGTWLFLQGCASSGSESKSAGPAAAEKPAKADTALVEVTTATFAAQVLEASQPVVVQFHAGWCNHCRAVSENLRSLSADHAGRVRVVAVDIDAQADLAEGYEIESVPTLAVFVQGKAVGKLVGQRDRSELAPIFEALAGPNPASVEALLRALGPPAEGSACDTRLAESDSGDGATCPAPAS